MASPSRVETIFFQALERKTAKERADFLDGACGADTALRLKVERLLESHPQAIDFLAEPAVDAIATGSTTLTNCTLSGNSASANGGALNNTDLGTTTLTNSTVKGNTASNNGGGLANEGSSLALSNCTITGNSAVAGGGIYNDGTLTVTGSTLSANTATVAGGGIYNLDTLSVGTTDFMGNTPDNLVGTYTDLGGNTFS